MSGVTIAIQKVDSEIKETIVGAISTAKAAEHHLWTGFKAMFTYLDKNGAKIVAELPDITAEVQAIEAKLQSLGIAKVAITLDPKLAVDVAAIDAVTAEANVVANDVQEVAAAVETPATPTASN